MKLAEDKSNVGTHRQDPDFRLQEQLQNTEDQHTAWQNPVYG